MCNKVEENSIYLGNCLELLKAVEEKKIDITITSPPYNLDMPYDEYDDKITYEDYLKFSEKWIKEIYRISKDSGRFCLNIPVEISKCKGGHKPVYSDLLQICLKVGWKYNTTVIWSKQNIHKRTAWGSWKSCSAPNIVPPVEVIVIFFKEQWKKLHKGITDVTKEEFIKYTVGNWDFKAETKKKKVGFHPAPFPEDLPYRCLKMFSYVGDLVLDPFSGSGTTCVVAKKINRNFIGIEMSKQYYDFSLERIKEV